MDFFPILPAMTNSIKDIIVIIIKGFFRNRRFERLRENAARRLWEEKHITFRISRAKFKKYNAIKLEQCHLIMPSYGVSFNIENVELVFSVKDVLIFLFRKRLPRKISCIGKNMELSFSGLTFPKNPGSFVLIVSASDNASTWTIKVDGLELFPGLPQYLFYFVYSKKDNAVKLSLELPDIHPGKLLSSLSPFYCPHLQFVVTNGVFSIKALTMFHLQKPAKQFFDVQLIKNDFFVNDNVISDFGYLNSPFVHNIISDGKLVKQILLDELNTGFTKLNAISEAFLNVVICTEDPNFYRHKGFDKKQTGFAIATNLSERRFARGASTITMQVVKNLFLTMEKSLRRKLEEIIITWLIEDKGIVSKNRLLEIYLNIIQFGTDLYGIREAAWFYFAKDPAEIDVSESLVLSYIIPRPLYFLEAVQQRSPRLITNLRNHVEKFSHVLLKRKLITKKQFDSIRYEVQFSNQPDVIKF
jgi:hypothetical protein